MRRLITSPVFPDAEKTQAARTIFVIIWISIPAILVSAIVFGLVFPENGLRWLEVAVAVGVLGLIVLVLIRSGYVKLASLSIFLIPWTFVTLLALSSAGIASQDVYAYVILVFLAGLLLGERWGLVAAGWCALSALGMVLVERAGVWSPTHLRTNPEELWFDLVLVMIPIAALQYIVTHALKTSLRQTRQELGERKRADETLKRYQILSEHARDIILFVEPDGQIIEANAAAARAYGYSIDELVTMNIRDLRAAESQATIAHQMAQAGSEGILFETAHHRRDGSTFQVEVSSRATDLGNERVLLSIIRDITARKQAEEESYHSRQMLQLVLDTIPQRVFWKDRDLNLLGCNRPFALDAGAEEPEALIGRSDFEMAWKDVADLYRADDRKVIESGQAKINYEEPQTRPDESKLWLRTSKVPLRDRQGQVLGILGTYEDITERKQAEQDLVRRSQELTTLYEIGQAFSKTLEPAEILERIYEAVGTVLDNRNLYIALYDRSKQSISFPVYTMNGERVEPSTRPFGDGMSEYVIQTKAALFIPRDLTAELERRGIAAIGTLSRCLLAVPMIVGEKVLGVIAVQDYERADVFDTRHLELLSTLASQAAIALENAQLFKETRERAEQLATLNEIGRAVSGRLEVESVLETVYQQLNRVMSLDSFYIALYDQETNLLKFPLLYDNGARHSQPDTSLVQGTYTRRVIETGAPLLINRTLAELAENRVAGLMIGDQPRRAAALMFVPLCERARTVGVLSVQSNTFNAYSEEHLVFLNGVASQVTIALENARLFEHKEQSLQRMQALHEIDKAITSTLDLRTTFETYLTQLLTQLDVDAAAVLLLRRSTQTLEYAAGRGFRTQGLQHTRLRLGEGIAGRVALERRIQIIPNLEKESEDFARSRLLAEEGFVTYFGVPLVAKGQLSGVLEIFQRHPTSPDQEWLEYLEMLATQAAIAIDNMMLFEDLQQSNSELSLAYDTTLEGWSRALDLRDQETEGHTQRVTEMAIRLGRQAGIRESELVHLRRGALLHDIGKMGITDAILLKPGPLTPAEWEVMRQHPVIAYRLLSPITHLRLALDIPYCHHEKWDGTGYPRGLKGEEIPFAARLFAVADVWDALCSARPYRPAWAIEKVREYIQSEAGKHFDPQAVDIFLKAGVYERP